MPRYTLIGTELSLFTGKIKTYLQWKGVPFEVLLPSDEVYRNVVIPGAGIAMIPVLLIHDDNAGYSLTSAKVLQDTKEIMDYFETLHPPGSNDSQLLPTPMHHPILPPTPTRAFAARLLELLADEWLVTQAMYWRWHPPHLSRQDKFLAAEFGNSSTGGLAPFQAQQTLGAKRMARFAGFTPGLGVSETTSPALEWQFHELLRLMERHFDSFPFLLGNEISLADFAFWGCFGPHLGRDPVPSFLIKTEAPGVWEWIERVNGGHRWAGREVRAQDGDRRAYGMGKPHSQEVLHDTVPESTCRVLRFLLRDYAPVLAATVSRTVQYIDRKGGSEVSLPRSLGEQGFQLTHADGKVGGTRRVQTHAVWELDRIITRSMETDDQRLYLLEWVRSECGEEVAGVLKEAISAWTGSGRRVRRDRATLIAVAEGSIGSKL
ncbi:hypothetical protein B0A50_08080 [Salinomyces thailandicus]|uniref:GST N-terminal domain-containing protein n=1 Tax=Salinomyces thailandicus TaxID=706561 RepID=A0A4V5N383_9PEZI|nr:hypothetical protein B0A50_08080 [Salinomyces thailandica]